MPIWLCSDGHTEICHEGDQVDFDIEETDLEAQISDLKEGAQ